jgi:DNA-binding MarR family transcriptional regulator
MTTLTDTQVHAIRNLYAKGARQIDLAKHFKVRQTTISSVVTGILHKDAPGPLTHTFRASGERHGLSKLTTEQVEQLRLAREIQPLSYRELGKMFGITASQARAICIGKARKNG